MKEIFLTIIGGLFSGIIIYIVKGFFTNLEDRINRAESSFSSKIKDSNEKIDKIMEAHANIYNDILGKFSNWEDRIKKILDDSISKQASVSPSDFRKDILNSFSDLDKVIKRDMVGVKRDMDVMNHHIRKTEAMVNSLKIDDGAKQAMRDVLKATRKIEEDKNRELNEMDNKLSKIFAVCKVLISDSKHMETKINIIRENSRNKIKFNAD